MTASVQVVSNMDHHHITGIVTYERESFKGEAIDVVVDEALKELRTQLVDFCQKERDKNALPVP